MVRGSDATDEDIVSGAVADILDPERNPLRRPGVLPRVSNDAARRKPLDPRWYQIGALAALLCWGLAVLDFDVSPARVALLLAGALGVQYACTRTFRLPAFEAKSALISGLSLCLLLRTNSAWLALLAAAAAIAGKFLLRWNGKHLFNPTNFGIAAVMLATGQAWVSPAQWGNAAFFGFLLVCVGGLVVFRSARSDVTLAFLAGYLALVVGRSLWLGEPLAIPLHRLQSGALLIFSFFMISDPKTTPDSRAGRILFAILVAAGAATIQFRLFRTNGPIWSLFFFSLLVPVIDRVLPGPRYAWAFPKGVPDEASPAPSRLLSDPLRGEPSRAPVLRLLRGQGRREAL
jgi:Na+-translocating ferredoxin:NAD+ oxidoreductase RnfD subunit